VPEGFTFAAAEFRAGQDVKTPLRHPVWATGDLKARGVMPLELSAGNDGEFVPAWFKSQAASIWASKARALFALSTNRARCTSRARTQD